MAELHENERQSLIQKLHDSVKQCQAAFGDKKSSLATESDSSVACVIVHFEQVLLHGLKRSRVWEKITSITEPLRQVTQKMLPEIEITFWSLLKEYLGSLDIQHFQNLEGITTDSGRARVWLRTAINENTLENHLNSILGHKTLRSQFYEPWALMMDEEKASTVPTMARGLGSILFAIDTKSTELNRPFKNVHTKHINEQEFRTHRRIKSSPLPVMAERWDNVTTPNEPITSRRKKKKRKVVEATINDMDDGLSSSLIQTRIAPNLNEVKEDNELYYSSTPDLSMNTDDKQLENDSKESSGIEETLVQHDKIETSKDYNDKDEHILQLGVSNDFYPQQDIIMDSVDPTIYSVDYDNECVAAQLETLKISPPSNIPLEDECEKNTDELIERTNSEISDKTSCPPLSSSTEMSNIEDELLVDNSSSNSYESFSDMVSDYMQNTTTGEIPVDIVNKNDADSRTEDNQDGYENTTYLQILAFDQESSQAANDTLALLSASNSNPIFQVENEVDADIPPTCLEIDKYVPKVDHQLHENPGGQTSLSTGDLKKAILATAKKKDEVEEKRRLLQCAFDEQQEELYSLRLENEKMRSEFEEKEIQYEIKMEHLNQEIDFLKKQLKKYVSSIQTLGKDENNCEEPAKPTFHNQARSTEKQEESAETQSNMDEKVFEKRLQQMAQMHGELMEFQENLQKQLISKNNEISQLKEQLISLRGPLPDDDDVDDNVSHQSVESTYSPSKMLINIWIPSVFLKTKGTESYHLYQVYVHVGNDEWNIYRRYSQFNKLHIEVCKSHPALEKFNFPKKKIFGKKDEKLVEKRRHQFQEYLRTVINTLITSKSMSSSNASRRKLIELLPFFGENYDEDSDRKKKSKKNKNTESTPQYSGL